MSTRPEYVKCIASTHQDLIGRSLCDRPIGRAEEYTDTSDPHIGPRTLKKLRAYEFVFIDIDHWFHEAQRGGRLLLCAGCAKKIREALQTQACR